MNNLGGVYQSSGQHAKAAPLFEETLEKTKAKLGPDHPDTLNIMGNLAVAYQETGQLAKAVSLLEETLQKCQPKLGDKHPYTIGVMANLGLLLLQQKRSADAEQVLRDLLALRQTQIPDSWLTFNTQSMRGAALLGQQKYAEAEPLLVKGYQGMKAREKTIPQQGGGELRIPEALDRLIELYTALNQPDEAKKWQAERAKYPPGKTKTPEQK
jgi:tetratricopeptide (TPR) repeat protein